MYQQETGEIFSGTVIWISMVILEKLQCNEHPSSNNWKWKNSPGESGAFGALLADLFKVFSCLPYELLITKLYANGVDISHLKLLHSYFTNQKIKSEIN